MFWEIGQIGVAIFFLFSGYGLMSSKMKKPDYDKGFLKNKLLRIYSPFAVAFVLCLLVMLLFKFQITDNLPLSFIILSLPNTTNWYLKIQVLMYIAFFISLKLFKKNIKAFIIFISCASVIYMIIGAYLNIESFWYKNTLYFPIGLILAAYKNQIYNFITKRYVLSVIFSLILFCAGISSFYMFGGLATNLVYIFSFILIMFVLSTKLCSSSKTLEFFGKYSIEIYLSHTIMLKLFKLVDENNILYFIPFILISVVIALLIKYISKKIISGSNYIINKSFSYK